MSQLWKCYWENDVDRFRRLLAPTSHSQNTYPSKSPGTSPGAFGSLPRVIIKSRKTPYASAISKAEINSRDHAGLTLLLLAVSSHSPTARDFVEALLEHPAIDIYCTDTESGWNPLHRALYNGNISSAILLLEKERKDLTESLGAGTTAKVGQLIKGKDHEGLTAFDLFNASIALRSLQTPRLRDNSKEDGSDSESTDDTETHTSTQTRGLGDEVFMFGSNKNSSLGVSDGDDRTYPSQIHLKRPDHLIQYFYREFMENEVDRTMEDSFSLGLSGVPSLIESRPIYFQDLVLSKYSSAILTTDSKSNLYVTGVGKKGRLGLGNEDTQFNFVPVPALSDKKITQIAVGQDHSLAVTETGELWSWGSNAYSQLGYTLPATVRPDEESISTTPRQVFGSLKKEVILGVAASAFHSVAHTGTSLYCWGRNVGQLGLMDADQRAFPEQTTPRKVAAALVGSHESIKKVSAVDYATCALFEDWTVCVFTSYGYKMIKFPFDDVFHTSLKPTMSSRHDSGRREIHDITSGGDTIAALTGTGSIFTLKLNQKAEGSSSTSTTNPAKIKDAVNPPQLIWDSRKGRPCSSVAVGENGSVILSTQAGIYHRVRRNQKDTNAPGAADSKRKDFKFQRVPYISTGVIRVAASPFGAYAAIRDDSDVTREQIEVDEQTLWHDLAPLCVLRGLKAHNSKSRENKDTWRFQNPEVLKGQVDVLAYEVLTSTDLEEDLQTHLGNWSFSNEGSLSTLISTSSAPALQVPVHSWVLSARSPTLRAGLSKLQEIGSFQIPEVLTINKKTDTVHIEFMGIDLITLLNIVVYCYGDTVIPCWNFTRQLPPLAYRYRQIRAELMKVASKLSMPKLENAVRLQTSPPLSMDQDFRKAMDDVNFFDDADTLLELEGSEIPVHSVLCQRRCGFFDAIFRGRSKGAWLSARRAAGQEDDKVRIDLTHFNPDSFHYVLKHIYADVGDELFDHVVADNIDEFSELVMDVMNMANELMLDRLSQICQKTLGKFVTIRNISTLLNLISPCSVTEFKDKGLEYICLQMESMLENHLMDNLDEDLLLELDQVVRDNQLARCPFARSGRADLLLHERHPELAQDIEEERRIRIRAMAFKASQKDDERRLSSSFKTRFGSLEDPMAASPPPERTRQKSKTARNEPFSPCLRPKDSNVDLIFNMEEEDGSSLASHMSPSPRPLGSSIPNDLDQLPRLPGPWKNSKGKAVENADAIGSSPPVPLSIRSVDEAKTSTEQARRVSQGGSPWAVTALPTSRLDLREIMTESKPAQSALTAGLAAAKKDSIKSAPQKMSQKERKKQQAEQAARQESQSLQTPWVSVADKKASPWQTKLAPPKTSLNSNNSETKASLAPPVSKPLVAAETSGVSMPRRAASPDTRFSGQSRSGTNTPRGSSSRATNVITSAAATAGPSQTNPSQQPPAKQENKPLVPHSRSYIQKPSKQVDSTLGLGLADIIGQQQREQQSVREAVAKRSLQEIQQEQAFQEWWDQESRRLQEEEEARKAARERSKDEKKDREGGGNGRQRGRSRKSNKGGGTGGGSASTTTAHGETTATGRGGGSSRSSRRRGGKA